MTFMEAIEWVFAVGIVFVMALVILLTPLFLFAYGTLWLFRHFGVI